MIAALVLVADQYSKFLIVTHLQPGQSLVVIPHILWWTYVENTHGAFNLFGNQPVILIGLSLVVLAFFWSVFRKSAARSRTMQIGFGAMLGGAIGNIVDRLHYQHVVDFIDFRVIWQWIFNVADAAITIGVALLILRMLLLRRAESGAANS